MSMAIRVALIIAYCFCALSSLFWIGSIFEFGFLTSFTVQNGLDRPITVTPVGAAGPSGSRYPLPVRQYFLFFLPSAVRGGYALRPSESVTITYDMDDINFSEIVVDDQNGTIGQLIVNSDPVSDQYRAPKEDHFLIQRDTLVPVPPMVLSASRDAREPTNGTGLLLSILVLPWLAVVMLHRLRERDKAIGGKAASIQ